MFIVVLCKHDRSLNGYRYTVPMTSRGTFLVISAAESLIWFSITSLNVQSKLT